MESDKYLFLLCFPTNYVAPAKHALKWNRAYWVLWALEQSTEEHTGKRRMKASAIFLQLIKLMVIVCYCASNVKICWSYESSSHGMPDPTRALRCLLLSFRCVLHAFIFITSEIQDSTCVPIAAECFAYCSMTEA